MSIQPPVTAVIVLAAGEGTRMRSATPKVLHRIGGRSLLGHALASASALNADDLVVVVRHERDKVAAHVHEVAPTALVADQDEIPGTGRAVACAVAALCDVRKQLTGTVVVTCGDVPLLTSETLTELVTTHANQAAAVTVLTTVMADPGSYGRIVRDEAGGVIGIVEQKDATQAQRAITEVNTGVYAFDAEFLNAALGKLGTDNAQGEMYLTDVPAIAVAEGRTVAGVVTPDTWQVAGVNDRAQLADVGAELNRRIVQQWLKAGVTMVDPASTWIDVTVTVAPDVTLLPGTQLHGATQVAGGATIGPDTTVTDCIVGADATIVRSQVTGVTVAEAASVGPFSYLQPGACVAPHQKVAAFQQLSASASEDHVAASNHSNAFGQAPAGEGTPQP